MRRHLWISVLLTGVIALTACKVSDNGSGQGPGGQFGAQPGQQQGQPEAAVPQEGMPGGNPVQGGGPGGPNGGPNAGPTIDPTAAAAFQDINRLAVGMLDLQDAGTHPLSKDQAVTLLPLWKDVQTAMQPSPGQGQDGTPQPPEQGQDQTPGAPGQGGNFGGRGRGFFFGDPAKIAADVAGIRAALTPEQVSDINAMTQDEMNATLQKHSINTFFGFAGQGGGRSGGRNGGGNGNGGFQGNFGGTPGAFGTMRAEGTIPTRPTLSADELATAQARRNQGNPLYAAVITMLQALAGN